MSRRQEICRDFQRGSCRYGTRCKFLHQASTQQQQRQPQNQSQRNAFGGSGVSNYYGALASSTASQRPAQSNQSSQSAREHKCNDPRVCKDQIKEDFQNENPVFWRLTCYAHYKYLPNDIVGDVSPEELRAFAYEGAKQGLSLKDVAQREASMVAQKNAEFEALLRNPYKGPASQGSAAPFPSISASPVSQSSSTVMVFGQPLTLSSTTPAGAGFGHMAHPLDGATATGFSFGQASVPSGDVTFGSRPSTISAGPFGAQPTNVFQQSTFMNTSSPVPQPNAFQQLPFTSTTSPGAQRTIFQPSTFPGSALPGTVATPVANGNLSPFGFSSTFPGFPQSAEFTMDINSGASRIMPTSSLSNAVAVTDISTSAEGDAIWHKDIWKIGEIPEEEPPGQVRFSGSACTVHAETERNRMCLLSVMDSCGSTKSSH